VRKVLRSPSTGPFGWGSITPPVPNEPSSRVPTLRAGLPMTMASSGTSDRTTELEPTNAFRPIVTGPTSTACAPMRAPSQMVAYPCSVTRSSG
jgi:hypothetical protein